MEEYYNECDDNSLEKFKLIIHEDPNDMLSVKESRCPLCHWVVRLFQINSDEQFLMCRNEQCDYPFGITDTHIYKMYRDDELFSQPENTSTAGCSSSMPWSTASTKVDSLELQRLAKVKEIEQSEVELQKSVKQCQVLTRRLEEIHEDCMIGNEKWLQKLAEMQESTGLPLLTKEEMMRLKKSGLERPAEMNVQIESSGETISVKIDINDENTKN